MDEHKCNCGDDCQCTEESHCGCGGHGHDDFEMETINITTEDGAELECAVIAIFEVDGVDSEFIALLPPEEEIVYLYEYKEHPIEGNDDDIEIELLNIDDDALFEKVSNVFNQIMEDE